MPYNLRAGRVAQEAMPSTRLSHHIKIYQYSSEITVFRSEMAAEAKTTMWLAN